MRGRLLLACHALSTFALIGGAPILAQVRGSPGSALGVPAAIALNVGNETYSFSGDVDCKAAPQASIYGIPAELFSVTHSAGASSVQLSLWRPKREKPDMMSLHVALGNARYVVDTVIAGQKRDTKGSGQTTFQKSGDGGTFTIAAVASNGAQIRGTIKCSRFNRVVPEGG